MKSDQPIRQPAEEILGELEEGHAELPGVVSVLNRLTLLRPPDV
jgi:hypothetical protein